MHNISFLSSYKNHSYQYGSLSRRNIHAAFKNVISNIVEMSCYRVEISEKYVKILCRNNVRARRSVVLNIYR
jgi:hypothetical protein